MLSLALALSTLFPCPLVVFTFGLLLTSQKKFQIPAGHSLILEHERVSWVIFGMREDIGLVAAGILGAWLIWRRGQENTGYGSGSRSCQSSRMKKQEKTNSRCAHLGTAGFTHSQLSKFRVIFIHSPGPITTDAQFLSKTHQSALL